MKQRVDMVPIGAIEPGERFRKEFGDLKGLAHDISEKGLITPIAVMEREDGKFLLLAGERRLRAMMELNEAEVPVRVFPPGMNELQVRSIELSENLYRKDLEWHEHVSLTKQIHTLEQEIHGPKISTSPDAPGHGIRDTAELLNRSKSGVAEDLKLASAFEHAPEIFEACKTKKDAQKLLNKLEETTLLSELAARTQQEAPSKTVKKRLMDSFIVRDCFEGMAEVPDSSISFVEIDPPYAIDLEKTKREYSYGETYNEVRAKDYPKFLRRLFTESYRCMAEHSWIVVWFAHEPWFETVHKLMQEAGFKGSRMCGIWRKPTGQTQQPQYNLANCTEMFFYMRKGSPAIGLPGRINVFENPPVPPSQKTHPTERPIDLAKDLLATFALEGQRVMVPCCGSGNTLIAAHQLGMTPLGFELSGQYKDSFIMKVHKM